MPMPFTDPPEPVFFEYEPVTSCAYCPSPAVGWGMPDEGNDVPVCQVHLEERLASGLIYDFEPMPTCQYEDGPPWPDGGADCGMDAVAYGWWGTDKENGLHLCQEHLDTVLQVEIECNSHAVQTAVDDVEGLYFACQMQDEGDVMELPF